MTAPRAFYLTLPNGNPKLLTVNTLGELEDIMLVHYPLEVGGLGFAVWAWQNPDKPNVNGILREVQA